MLALLLLVFVASAATGYAAEPGSASPPVQQRRVALVVGNGTYVHLPRLANPPNDARLIAATLKDLGFALIGGGPQLNLDKAGFDRAVQGFGAALQQADVGLFYYAGHGLQVQGVNWLVPIGADPVAPQDLDFQMVDAELVLKQMQLGKTRLNVVVLDACRNNPFGGRGLRAVQGGLAEMRAPEGTLIAYATQPGNVARDGEGDDSPFSQALATTLRQPGLDVFRLFNQVGLLVKRETGGDQQPWVSSSPIDGEFYFSNSGPGGAPTTLPVTPDIAAVPPRSAPQQAPQKAPQKEAMLAPPPDELRPQVSLFAASVRALNQVSHDAELSYDTYVKAFNPERGPTGKETFVSLGRIGNSASLPELEQLKQALAQARGGEAADPAYLEIMEPDLFERMPTGDAAAAPDPERLPVLGRQYVDAAETLIALYRPAEAYYDQENFKDDNFTKGRAMHAGLITAFRNFLRSSERLRQAVRSLSAAGHAPYMASLKDHGRMLQYGVLHSIDQARKLVDFVCAGVAGGKDIRRIDLVGLKTQIDLTEQSLADLRQQAGGGPNAAQGEYGLGGDTKLAYYIEVTAQLVTESKYLWRSVRDKKPLDQQLFAVGGGYESDIIARFNSMVYAANGLH